MSDALDSRKDYAHEGTLQAQDVLDDDGTTHDQGGVGVGTEDSTGPERAGQGPKEQEEQHASQTIKQEEGELSSEPYQDQNRDELVISQELHGPPLPPRPSVAAALVSDSSASPSGSIRNSKAPARPKLQSKATTALSLADVHTPLPSDIHNRSSRLGNRQPSIRSLSNFRRSNQESDSDAGSIRSIRSYAPGYGGDIVSLLGEFPGTPREELHFEEGHFFERLQQEDTQFETYFHHEFDDLEPLASDGSNEEALMVRWRLKLKHFLILSSAGKPIYSRHGDDQLISNSIGVIQTIISIFNGSDDSLKGFTAGDARFVILSKGHLHLVSSSRIGESDAQLRAQLDALYMQILSTLTLPTMQRMFLNRPSTDLRRPLEGTDTLLSALADGFTRGSPSTLLSALESLRMRKTQRDAINATLAKVRTPNLLYGLIVAGGRLVSVIRPRKHSLHPGDLQLIFNMLFEAESVRAGGGENWIPLCLPGFNNTGYLHMYVSFLSPSNTPNTISSPTTPDSTTSISSSERPSTASGRASEIAIILISNSKDSFFELRTMRDTLVSKLLQNGTMTSIRSAISSARPSCTDICPGTVIRHFLYKSRTNVQFVMPSASPHFSEALAWRRLMSLYDSLYDSVHGGGVGASVGKLKVYMAANRNFVSLAWTTSSFELYAVAGVGANRDALVQGANRVVQWVRKEEQRLFVVGGAVF